MALKIDVLMPSSSQYEVLHHFARKLYEAFVRSGASCRLLSGDERIYATLNSPPDFTIGFNGALKVEDGSLVCDHIKVPHVSCLVDPPFRFLELTSSPFVIITCDDQTGCSLLKTRGFDRAVFLPHAVEQELVADPHMERIYDIAFLATCIDGEKRKKDWKKHFGTQIFKVMDQAAEAALGDNTTSFISVLEEQLDPKEYQQVYEEVEMYIKGVDREELLNAFPDHPVHVFGGSVDQSGWKDRIKKHSNIIVHDPVSYHEALEIMKRSKVVLNSSIKNKLGAHERIFTAAACGAVVVTNDNPLMQQYFRDGKDLFLYDRLNFEKTRRQVQDVLDDENKRLQIAEAGRACVMSAHTWDHRVEQLLKEILPMLKKMKNK